MIESIKMGASVMVFVALALVGCGSSNSGSAVPAAPSDLKAEELEGGAHLTWKDNSDNESGFMIERKVGATDYTTLATVPFNTTQYHDPNLTAGTAYTYHVMAMGKEAGKDSGFSNEVNFILGAGSNDGGTGGDAH